MEPLGHRLLRHRILPGVLGMGCVVGALFGVLNGAYLLALSQIFFAAAMALTFFEAESKPFVYLTWTCLCLGILVTAVAAAV